jgi:hypothetical protein
LNVLTHRKTILLLVWLAAAAAFTFPMFVWQLDYFRKPGPGYREAFLVLSAALVLAGFFYERIRPSLARFEPLFYAAIPISLGLLHDPVSTLVVLLTAASACALGGGLFRAMSVEAEPAVDTALGLGVLMSAFTWLGMAGLLYPQIVLLVLLVPLAIFRGGWSRLLPAAHSGSIPLWNSLAAIFGLIFLLCSACVMIAPALAFDVIRQHLPAAQFYAAHHRIAPLPLNEYSYFPQGVETLMAAALTLASPAAAQMVPVLFFGLAVLLCRSLALRTGLDNSGAWMGALCAAALPFAHWTGSVAKNDLALTCFEFASLYCLVRWGLERAEHWLFAAAAFLGFACSIKYIVLFGALPLGLLLLHACWRNGRWRTFVTAVAIVAATGLAWPLRAWVLTGNPAYPEHLGRSGSFELAKASLPWSDKLIAFLETPWTMHFHAIFASPLPAPAGVLLVLFLPVWFLSRRKGNTATRYCLFFAILYWLYWAALWPVMRFGAAPLMLLVVLTTGCVFSWYAGASKWTRAAINGALVYSLLFCLSGVMIMEINAPQIRFLARRINGREYVRGVLPSVASLDFLAGAARPGDLVLSIGNCALTYAGVPWNYECLSPRLPPAQIRRRLSERPFRFLILPSHFTPPVVLRKAEYSDAAFSVYRLDPGAANNGSGFVR